MRYLVTVQNAVGL